MVSQATSNGCVCHGCGRTYRMDLMVDDALWQTLYPANTHGGGLLCPSCIVLRIEQQEGFCAFQLVRL